MASLAFPAVTHSCFEASLAPRSSRGAGDATLSSPTLSALSVRMRKFRSVAEGRAQTPPCVVRCVQENAAQGHTNEAGSQLREVLLRVVASGIVGLSVLGPIPGNELLMGRAPTAIAEEGSSISVLERVEPEVRAKRLAEVLAQRKQEAQEAAAKAEAERLAVLAKKEEEQKARIAATEAAKSPTPKKVVSTVVAAKKTKSHGFMPLFLSQFFVLAALSGLTVALFIVPQGGWTVGQQKMEEVLEKVTPPAEAAWIKAKPYMIKAWDALQKYAEEAKPYVAKAAAQAQPVVLKAVENAKPVIKQWQEKLAEALSQAQAKVKSP